MRKLLNHINKNTLLFTAGLAGVVHETLLSHSDRPTLLILFAAMMGLPAFLSPGSASEEWIRGKPKHPSQDKEEGEDD